MKSLKITGRSLVALLAIFLLIGTLACFPRKKSSSTKPVDKPKIDFYVVNHGYHMSFVIPVKSPVHNWQGRFEELPKGKYLELAWGDADYYQKGGLLNGAKALLWPSSSVMHVVSLSRKPGQFFRNEPVYKLTVKPYQFRALLNFIDKGFAEEDKADFTYLNSGLYGNSGFYKAKPVYHLVYNCNNWVNQGLYQAHQKTPLWGGAPFILEWYLD